jgi:hypothetical protein
MIISTTILILFLHSSFQFHNFKIRILVESHIYGAKHYIYCRVRATRKCRVVRVFPLLVSYLYTF